MDSLWLYIYIYIYYYRHYFWANPAIVLAQWVHCHWYHGADKDLRFGPTASDASSKPGTDAAASCMSGSIARLALGRGLVPKWGILPSGVIKHDWKSPKSRGFNGKSRISPTKKGFSNAMFDHHRVYKSKWSIGIGTIITKHEIWRCVSIKGAAPNSGSSVSAPSTAVADVREALHNVELRASTRWTCLITNGHWFHYLPLASKT